jgi:hypothetical protein
VSAQVTFTVQCDPEDLPLVGAFTSGDPTYAEEEAKLERELLKRSNEGDAWAWCYVTVTATVVVDSHTFVGVASMGGCSYKDEAEFKADDYFSQMKNEAMDDILTRAQADLNRAKAAGALLRMGVRQ